MVSRVPLTEVVMTLDGKTAITQVVATLVVVPTMEGVVAPAMLIKEARETDIRTTILMIGMVEELESLIKGMASHLGGREEDEGEWVVGEGIFAQESHMKSLQSLHDINGYNSSNNCSNKGRLI